MKDIRIRIKQSTSRSLEVKEVHTGLTCTCTSKKTNKLEEGFVNKSAEFSSKDTHVSFIYAR